MWRPASRHVIKNPQLASRGDTPSRQKMGRGSSEALQKLLAIRNSHRPPVVIAHRGGSLWAPENTLPAIRIAKGLHVGGIEVDVRGGHDGSIFVIHDATLERTTTGRGAVDQVTETSLRGVDAGVKFDRRFHQTRVPTLAEALRAADPVPLIIEVKEEALVESVAAEVVKRGAWRRSVVMSFHVQGVVRAAARYPRVRFGRLVKLGWRGRWNATIQETVLGAVKIGASFLCVDVKGCTAELVRVAHRHRLPVWVWTVDRVEVADRLVEWGVEALISNDPPLIVGRVAQWAEWGSRN